MVLNLDKLFFDMMLLNSFGYSYQLGGQFKQFKSHVLGGFIPSLDFGYALEEQMLETLGSEFDCLSKKGTENFAQGDVFAFDTFFQPTELGIVNNFHWNTKQSRNSKEEPIIAKSQRKAI